MPTVMLYKFFAFLNVMFYSFAASYVMLLCTVKLTACVNFLTPVVGFSKKYNVHQFTKNL